MKEVKGEFEYYVESLKPLNPYGRTGIQGRGRLRNWGPNHSGCFLSEIIL